MDIGTIAGMLVGLTCVVGSIVAGGGAAAFIHIPSVLITIGGTIAATLITSR